MGQRSRVRGSPFARWLRCETLLQFGLRPIPPLDRLAAEGGKYPGMPSHSRLASAQNDLELYAQNF